MDGTAFAFLLAISTAVDALAAGLTLFFLPFPGWRGAGRTITVPRVLASLCVLGFIFLAKLPVVTSLGINLFGMIHLAYLHAAVTLPAGGILVLLASSKIRGRRLQEATGLARVVSAAAIALAGAGFYATWIEPFSLRLERVEMPLETPGNEVRIGVLSDLQTDRVTSYEQGVVTALMSLQPDLILLPGDFFQGTSEDYERELPALRQLLAGLKAPGGVFAVPGNFDSAAAGLRRAFEGTSIRLLEEEPVEIEVRGRAIRVASHAPVLEGPSTRLGLVRILLNHYPDAVLGLSRTSPIDLVVAGHTHGGQVQIPWIGPLVTFSRVPRHVAGGGLHRVDGHRIFVSRGAGHERGQAPRLRLFCPPEVSLITLRSGTSTETSP
jgi:uncharacterized protein